MRNTVMPVATGFLAVILAASSALAGEPADLQRQLDELKAKIEKLEAKKESSAPGEKKASSWADKITLFGDFRYRHEDIEQPGRDTDLPDQNRDRIRLRVGLKAKVNDEVDVIARLATGSTTDPVSTNTTLGSSFNKMTVVLDQAYFDYHPQALKDMDVPVNLLGGKFDVPFVRAGGSDLIWDGDLTPEGFAARINPKLGDSAEIIAVLGGFWAVERHTSTAVENNEDAGMFGAQAALKLKFEEKGKVYALAGAGYLNYMNTEGKARFRSTTSGYGNTTNGTLYQYDYDMVEGFAEIGFPVMDIPVTLYADYVVNQASDVKEDVGYLFGLNIGKLKDQWDWSIGYNYRELEKDCVIGAFTDSDAGGGGTNIRGHKFSAQLSVLKNVTVGAALLLNEVNISKEDTVDEDADYRRLQLDLMFKF